MTHHPNHNLLTSAGKLARRPSLTLMLLTVLAIAGAISKGGGMQSVEAASVLDSVPGGRLLRDLSNEWMGALGGVMEDTVNEVWHNSALANHLANCVDDCAGGAPYDPDTKRNVSQIIMSRGFHAEEHQVVTRDGYILTIQRIINPLVEPSQRSKQRPVILQHGLMSSSVDWVINSVDVRPTVWPKRAASSHQAPPAAAAESNSMRSMEPTATGDNSIEEHRRRSARARATEQQQQQQNLVRDSQEHPNSLGFYLANEGYDVFLANSRGNVYGQRHVNMSSWQPKFWDFTFDEQIAYDLPDTIAYVQRLTNRTKVGYVGHSQGTTMALGLLSDQPHYADILEPVILLAPVAYANHVKSPVRYFSVYTPVFSHINMWFGSSNAAVRYLGPIVCGPQVVRRDLCANLVFLSTGFDEKEFNDTRVSAYLSHMPSGTSVKNVAHWGQAVISGRFAHFDHGLLGNQLAYSGPKPPAYELANIKSNSLTLFVADNDWLAPPEDVAHLLADLRVKPFAVHNISEKMPAWNHIDFVYGMHAGQLINVPIMEVFNHFNPQPPPSS